MSNARKLVTVATVAVAMAALAAGVGLNSAAAQEAAKTYKVDNAHSDMVFGAQHVGAGYVYGKFNEMSGEFSLGGGTPSFKLTVQTASLDTGNENRDGHLKGPDFFNIRQFPTITFESKSAEQKGDFWYVTGDVTMLGTTKQVTVPVRVLATDASFKGNTLGAVHAEFTIQRSDFGMTWGVDKGIVSDEIKMIVSLEGAMQ
jgi:polyisoprenoid-binding protein YceI